MLGPHDAAGLTAGWGTARRGKLAVRRALTAAGILGMLLVVACCGGFASLSWQRLNAMGEGSPRRAETWRRRLQGVADPDVARAIGPKVVSKRFADGEWVFGVCEDSHADPQAARLLSRTATGGSGRSSATFAARTSWTTSCSTWTRWTPRTGS